MPIKIFKRGDVVVPLPKRKSSNDYIFSKGVEFTVVKHRNNNKIKGLDVRITRTPNGSNCIKRKFYDTYHREGELIEISASSVKLKNQIESIYPIY